MNRDKHNNIDIIIVTQTSQPTISMFLFLCPPRTLKPRRVLHFQLLGNQSKHKGTSSCRFNSTTMTNMLFKLTP